MPRSVRAALAAAVTALVAVPLCGGPAAATEDPELDRPGAAQRPSPPRPATPSRAGVRRADATPLTLTIDTLTPGSIPARGRVSVAGTVTNADSVVWRTVNIYSFISEEPMRTAAELADAVQVEESAQVGRRIVDPGNFATIDALAPGETTPFTLTVDVDLLTADSAGVYWFGVHALGERGDEGRDETATADGRARTFLPRIPERRDGQAPVAVGIPLRGNLEYAEDGSLEDLERWIVTLGLGGRLRSLVDLGGNAGDRTVTWVVDPALLGAVRQLAAGNPPRSLEPNLQEGEEDGEPVAPSPGQDESGDPDAETSPGDPSATPSDAATEEPVDPPEEDPAEQELPEDLDPQTRQAAEAAREWLARLSVALDDEDEVLVLPYGDLDVSAAARHDRDEGVDAYTRALGRSALPLAVLDRTVTATPAVAAPNGYLSPEALEMLGEDVTAFVSDQAIDRAPAVADVEGHRLVVTSTGATAGGPAPGNPRDTVALRQRIIAEAAVRFLTEKRPPLVVLLPPNWVPPTSGSFFSGMDLDWLDLTSVSDAADQAEAQERTVDELRYPERQEAYELDAANFAAVDALREAGEKLQSLLTLNNVVGGTVTDQSLAMLSYAARTRPDSTRAAADRSRRWIEERLGQVRVSTPQGGVTLSSINGSFPATIRNDLDQPVTVGLAVRGSDDLQISAVDLRDLAVGGRESVLLDARTQTPGVHEVTIVVTDKTGRPLGGSDELSVRSARVSNVIWLFLAAGSGLLFGTIAFRLVRRVRAARR
jgi:hypothetical protein